MAREIERKFLVKGDEWRAGAEGVRLRQGYLSSVKERTVRIRTVGDRAYITVKGLTVGVTRTEYEYEIPFDECTAMLDRLAEKPLIEKVRYRIPFGGFIWEIDEFEGANAGLVVAEIELPDAGTPFEKPSWAGDEVSDDPRYFNSNLVRHPYTTW